MFRPKPYFRLINSSKQYHKHKAHGKLIKLHIKNTPNGVTVKKIHAKQVTGTICQHHEAHFRSMHKQVNQCKHNHTWYEIKLDMTRKAWKKESYKYAS